MKKIQKAYAEAIGNADFTGIKDDYVIDIKLYNIVKSVHAENVPAMGIGIVIEDSNHIGGGIIGNPNDDGESADDSAAYIGNNLWCVAYSGRFGVVFKSDRDKSDNILTKIHQYNKEDIVKAVTCTKEYLLENTDMFIILADGSGKGAYPYCASYDGVDFGEIK
ncbi:MAG: hypothetical protein LUE88_03620 [Clostridiales bacterium]|nr:hypothetical protein [Clostridiales bacterium]